MPRLQRLHDIFLAGNIFLIPLCPVLGVAFRRIVQDGVDLVEFHWLGAAVHLAAILVEIGERFIRRTEPGQVTAACHEHHLVGQHHVLGGVGDHDDRAPLVGQAALQVHEGGFRAGVETGGRLVEEEQARAGEQLHADRDALLLSAAQAADLHILAVGQVEILEHLQDALVPLGRGRILGHAQLGGKVERLVDRQLHVDDVFLRHVTDLVADGVEVLVDIDVVDEYLAMRGGAISRDRIDQGGFPAAALSHDHDKFTRLEDQRDILQQVEILAHPLVDVVGLHPHALGLVVAR